MVRISSNHGGESPKLPGTPPTAGTYAAGLQSKRFEIEDEDLEELFADDHIPCSSPFFTQPTQIVNRTTQPTQIVEKRTTLKGAPSDSPNNPKPTIVEVPASSPFQSAPRPQPLLVGSPRPLVRSGGKLASLMAPAGTAFRAPVMAQPQKAPKREVDLVELSDDDLAKDYKRADSSDEERAPRIGQIRPSKFTSTKEPTPRLGVAARSSIAPKTDITINDIPDLRVRYLTKELQKLVTKSKPNITVAECRDAVMKGNRSFETAVQIIMGKSAITGSPASESSTSTPSVAGRPQQIWRQTNMNSFGGKNVSTATISPPASEASKGPAPPRRRLIQGRRNPSPTPPPVFSLSSSQSSGATTPASSSESPAKAHQRKVERSVLSSDPITADSDRTTFAKSAANPAVKPATSRRRLVSRNERSVRPDRLDHEVINVDSDEDLPSISKLASRKRKAPFDRDAVARPTQVTEISSGSEGPDPLVAFTDSRGYETDSSDQNSDEEQEEVLKYLNSCSTEELARMAGIPVKDSQLVIAARPFDSTAAVERVGRKQKTGLGKSSRVQLGSTIIEKLTNWFNAFSAASAVITKCEERAAKVQSVMSTWEMDKDGKPKTTNPAALIPLPVPGKPKMMADSIKLKSYQLFGLNWLSLMHSYGYSGILADDMGLGKTCQVISFIAHLMDIKDKCERQPWPNLIVVPPSTLENWVNEFARFAPDIKVFIYAGTHRRDTDPEEARGHHVVLTSYSQIERNQEDRQWLQGLDAYAAIFDEGHKLKNTQTLVYKNLRLVPSEWRLVLSGTPVQNNLKELLSLLHFVEPRLFRGDDFERLQTIFEAKVASKDVHNFAALAKERVGNARAIVAPFILQRRKDDVLELAKKIETRVVVGMHPDQRDIYNEIRGSYLAKGNKSAIKRANPWMQLRKAAIHPQLFRKHFSDKMIDTMTNIMWSKCSAEELEVQSKEPRHKEMFKANLMEQSDFQLHLLCRDFERYIGKFDIPTGSWEEAPKVQKLLELVRGYIENGDRCLVFSRFEMVINILRETLHHADIPYCELTGMAGVADRFPEIQKFNENPDIPVFLLTTGAGGTGLNLTAANKIIIFDQSDNPQDDVQASNRAHRIGQTREVEVIRIITENTVEGLIYNSCVKKLMLAACVDGTFAVGDDEESVEEECRKLMLLEAEDEFRSSQI